MNVAHNMWHLEMKMIFISKNEDSKISQKWEFEDQNPIAKKR